MDEPVPPMASNNYVHEHTRNWSRIIDSSDGFIFITPEYNHGLSPVLKNAVDFLYQEWQEKPVALVGYGGSDARESIRQLREVLNTVGLKPLEDQIGIGKIWEAFDENASVKEDHIRGDIKKLIEKLISALR
jgi:NAD(P)H-dependent FMN reductase